MWHSGMILLKTSQPTITMLWPLTATAVFVDGLTPHLTSRGEPFLQLYQRLGTRSIHTEYEANFDSSPGTAFAQQFWWAPMVIVAVYLAAVFAGQRFMVNRERLDLRHMLAAWNALLCLFSFAGALRTVPELLFRISSEPFTDTVCADPASTWGAGASGLWVGIFIFSKVPELVSSVQISTLFATSLSDGCIRA